jgi:hypothetical protein
MSYLDDLLNNYRRISIAGTLVPQRPQMNWASGVTAVDNASTNSTDLTASGTGGGSLPAGVAAGDLVYYNGTAWVILAPGAVGQALLQGSGPTPQWSNVPSGDEGTIVAPPVASNWTHINFGGGTSIIDSGKTGFPTVYLSDFTTGGGELVRAGTVALTSPIFTLTARIRPILYPANNASAGIGISDGTKFIVMQLTYVSGGVDIQVVKFTNSTTLSANYYSAAWNIGQNASFWFQIKNDGTHRFYNYSSDGVNYYPTSIGSSTVFPIVTTFQDFITTETRAALIIDPLNGTGSGITLESWNITYP